MSAMCQELLLEQSYGNRIKKKKITKNKYKMNNSEKNKVVALINDWKHVTDSASLRSSVSEFRSRGALTAKSQVTSDFEPCLGNSWQSPAWRSEAAAWLTGEQQLSNMSGS